MKTKRRTMCLLILPDRKTAFEFYPDSMSSNPRPKSTKIDIAIVTSENPIVYGARAFRKRLRELTKGKP